MDKAILRLATAPSIAIEESDQVLNLRAIVYYRKTNELHETVLGLKRDFGTGSSNVKDAMEAIIKKACTARIGRRKPKTKKKKKKNDKKHSKESEAEKRGKTKIKTDKGEKHHE